MKKSTQQLIREIHGDSSLSPSEKMTKIHEIMNPSSIEDIQETKEEVEDCPKYKRGCLLVCNVCESAVCCRLCHPEIDRFQIAEVVCKECETKQPVKEESGKSLCIAEGCANLLGQYYCSVCHMYSNDGRKPIYHCKDCGYCLAGIRENYEHCDACQMCVARGTIGTSLHNCKPFSYVDDSQETRECPVCLEALRGSNMTRATSVLKCGHVLHADCLGQVLQNDYRCVLCKKSAVDMTAQWKALDMRLAMAPQLVQAATGEREDIPEELNMKCICNDCGHRFDRLFSPYNIYKCGDQEGGGCGSYNTVYE